MPARIDLGRGAPGVWGHHFDQNLRREGAALSAPHLNRHRLEAYRGPAIASDSISQVRQFLGQTLSGSGEGSPFDDHNAARQGGLLRGGGKERGGFEIVREEVAEVDGGQGLGQELKSFGRQGIQAFRVPPGMIGAQLGGFMVCRGGGPGRLNADLRGPAADRRLVECRRAFIALKCGGGNLQQLVGSVHFRFCGTRLLLGLATPDQERAHDCHEREAEDHRIR